MLPVLRPSTAYLATTGLSVAGVAIGFLGATGATTAAGGAENGATYTGAYMALIMITSAVAVPYAARGSARFGERRTFAALRALMAITWIAAGVGLLMGLPTMAVLLAAAPIFGATGGIAVVLLPLVSRAYLASADGTSTAVARVSVVSGVAWAAGSALGGALLTVVPLGWGLVLDGLMSLPLVALVRFRRPPVEPVTPRQTPRPWHEVRERLTRNARVRQAALVGVACLFFLAPVSSLVVPIAQQLHEGAITGAAVLMVAFALGEFASPQVVERMFRRRSDLPGSSLALAMAGLILVALAAVSLVFAGRGELVAWLVVGVLFGAFRYASKAMFMGAAAEAGTEEDAPRNVSAALVVGGFAAPFGIVMWSGLVDIVSAEAALLVGGAGGVLAGLMLFRSSKRRSQAAHS